MLYISKEILLIGYRTMAIFVVWKERRTLVSNPSQDRKDLIGKYKLTPASSRSRLNDPACSGK